MIVGSSSDGWNIEGVTGSWYLVRLGTWFWWYISYRGRRRKNFQICLGIHRLWKQPCCSDSVQATAESNRHWFHQADAAPETWCMRSPWSWPPRLWWSPCCQFAWTDSPGISCFCGLRFGRNLSCRCGDWVLPSRLPQTHHTRLRPTGWPAKFWSCSASFS